MIGYQRTRRDLLRQTPPFVIGDAHDVVVVIHLNRQGLEFVRSEIHHGDLFGEELQAVLDELDARAEQVEP